MKTRLFFLIIILLAGNNSFAQQARVKRYTTPLCGTVVLKDVQDKYNAQVYNMELPDPDAAEDEKKLEIIKKQIKAKYPQHKSPAEKTTSGIPGPVVNISYVADSSPGVPPDNYTAVSNGNKAVSVMNDRISVHNATTGAMLLSKSLESFSETVGLNGVNNYRYDPKVVYDPLADRFICIILDGTNQYSNVIMGFSRTNDPAGSWAFYKFVGDYANDTTWFDYPAISITQNEVFFTGNKIKYDSSWQAGFKESVIYQIRKTDGYSAAASLTYQIWDSVAYNGKNLRCLYPLNPGSALAGPAQYLLSNRDFDVTNDSVFLVKVPDTIGSSDHALTVTAIASGATSYGVPPDGRQPDTSLSLATNDGRVLGGFINGTEIQFVSTSVDPSSGSSAVYHGTISNFTTAPSLHGSIFGIDTLDLAYPNISYTGNGNQSIISFDYSGPATYPGYGAIFFDGSGFSPMVNIHSGDSTIKMLTGKEQRWGDYSGSQPMWNAIGAVWVVGIYGRHDHAYGSYMAELQSPYAEAVPTVSPLTSTANVYPNPAFEYTNIEFNVTEEQLFSFYIYNTQGQLVDKLIDKFCGEGKNILRFNVAPLATGTYFIKATGSKGENIPAHTFVRR